MFNGNAVLTDSSLLLVALLQLLLHLHTRYSLETRGVEGAVVISEVNANKA